MSKVGIIGAGYVGVAAAYSLFQQSLCSELILVDTEIQRAEAQALDLMHAQAYVGRCQVKAGNYQDLSDCSIVIITAGVSQKNDETRLDLLQRNVNIFSTIIEELDKACPEAILIIATNPVDILTYISQEISQRPHKKVIGTGTMLDTSRFRSLLGEYYNVDPKSVHGFIVGEHGDSELPLWSSTNIAGLNITTETINGKPFIQQDMDKIFHDVKTAAYKIIEKKGHTDLAIGLMISHLVKTINNNQRSILPLSVRLEGHYNLEGLCMGLPCILGENGIEAVIAPSVSKEEESLIYKSAQVLLKSIKSSSF
jgi:L-lactate dehydrogenase